jgi:hypothetical protein
LRNSAGLLVPLSGYSCPYRGTCALYGALVRVTGFAFEPSHPGVRYLDCNKLIKFLTAVYIVQHFRQMNVRRIGTFCQGISDRLIYKFDVNRISRAGSLALETFRTS